jgi:hypothetical protein
MSGGVLILIIPQPEARKPRRIEIEADLGTPSDHELASAAA